MRVIYRSSAFMWPSSLALPSKCMLLRVYTSEAPRGKSLPSCPFGILGIDVRTESRPKYSLVKASFIELALAHHPDRPGGTVDQFLKVRLAFESIRELSDGTSQVVDAGQNPSLNRDHHHDDDSLADWFYHETGTNLSFHMDSKTRKEVADMVDNLSPGGLDRGGMWEMARMIAREEASKRMSIQVEKLESGEIKSGTSRRPRRS